MGPASTRHKDVSVDAIAPPSSHGWNDGPASALGHYQDLVGPLEVILSQNKTQWQGHTVAYFGVIWPSSKYADDLTVINMRALLAIHHRTRGSLLIFGQSASGTTV
jgi:hypothetical protein